MKLRNGRKTMEHICIPKNEWWLRYTKEHCAKYLHDGEMFNKNIYGRYTIEEWLNFVLPAYINTERYIRQHSKKL